KAQLARDLSETCGPAALLDAPMTNAIGNKAGNGRIEQKQSLPPRKRRANREIEIFAEGIGRPAARVLDCLSSPDAARAVELEQHARPRADALLHHEMGIEKQALGTRQPVGLRI